MTNLWPYEVGAKIGELQQRREVENQHRDVVNQRRDVVNQCRDVVESAETEHLDVAMLPNDVVTFGVGFGTIFSPF